MTYHAQCLQNTTPGLFADDTEIYALSCTYANDLIDNINYDLDIVTQWMENNKLQIHPKKYIKCMFILHPLIKLRVYYQEYPA